MFKSTAWTRRRKAELFFMAIAASGCLSPQALQPVARQNAENIAALSQNVLSVVSLYERYFTPTTEALVGLRIGQIRQGLIAVVGRSTAASPPAEAKWEDLFRNKPPFVHQREEIVSVLAQAPDAARRQELMRRHGWVYLTVADPAFTPQRAHRLVQDLAALQTKYVAPDQRGDFLREAEAVLIRSDPALEFYRAQIEAAKRILTDLRDAVTQQVKFADLHSRAILSFAQAEVDVGKTVGAILSDEDIKRTLEESARKHIKDPRLREAAIQLLSGLSGILLPGQ